MSALLSISVKCMYFKSKSLKFTVEPIGKCLFYNEKNKSDMLSACQIKLSKKL